MGTLYIAEYTSLTPTTEGGAAQVPREPPLTEQTVTFGVGAGVSVGFNAETKYVRIQPDAICSILFGAAPVATAANQRFAASQTEYKGVTPGHKVSAINNT